MKQRVIELLTAIFVTTAVLAQGCSPPMATTATPAASTRDNVSPASVPSGQDWQVKWEDTLARAKKEGRVSVYAHTSPETRAALTENFQKKYGIELDILLIIGALTQQRLLNERRAGIFYPGALISGGGTIVSVLKPQGVFETLGQYLILPEVTDPGSWEGGVMPYLDKDRQIIAFSASVSPYIVVNTEMVKPGEINSYQDLLAPKEPIQNNLNIS